VFDVGFFMVSKAMQIRVPLEPHSRVQEAGGEKMGA
jgi:hypothetical protein